MVKFVALTELYEGINNSSYQELGAGRAYPFWQVGTLLNQSADLLDRCLHELTTVKGLEAQAKIMDLEITKSKNLLNLRKRQISKKGDILEDSYEVDIDGGIYDTETLLEAQLANHKINLPLYATASLEAENARVRAIGTTITDAQTSKEKHISTIAENKERQNSSLDTVREQWAKRDRIIAKGVFSIQEEALQKLKNETIDGQILDYKTQAIIASKRCLRDFNESMDKLKAAEKGLEKIFNYRGDALLEILSRIGKNDSRIHEIVNWTRNAIQWLIQFQYRDQYFTLNISLKQLIDDVNINSELERGNAFEFRIPYEYFESYNYVRLQGISGFLLADKSLETPLSFQVEVPKKALVKFDDVSAGINQSELPVLTLGRVQNRNSCRDPEIVGTVSHKNMSPIGDDEQAHSGWKLKINTSLADISKSDDIDDIQLELYLVGQPQ
jgi:hypothetical protein